MKTLPILIIYTLSACLAFPQLSEKFFTQEGEDPTFAEVLKSGTIKPGERFSKGPVKGSKISVNHALLEKQTGKVGTIPDQIGLHTQVSGGINRKDFGNWTRWYQEDGTTQIFRLFKGEQNIRSGIGELGSQGRVEVYTKNFAVPEGQWSEWEGVYTIIKPVGANIFQLFHEGGQLWPFHIRMNGEGDIYYAPRRPLPNTPKTITLAKNMVGKSLRIRVRANGTDYEVFCKDPTDEKPWGKPVATGSYKPAVDRKISFRWGMYSGSKKGHSISNDALLFVSGVTTK